MKNRRVDLPIISWIGEGPFGTRYTVEARTLGEAQWECTKRFRWEYHTHQPSFIIQKSFSLRKADSTRQSAVSPHRDTCRKLIEDTTKRVEGKTDWDTYFKTRQRMW